MPIYLRSLYKQSQLISNKIITCDFTFKYKLLGFSNNLSLLQY